MAPPTRAMGKRRESSNGAARNPVGMTINTQVIPRMSPDIGARRKTMRRMLPHPRVPRPLRWTDAGSETIRHPGGVMAEDERPERAPAGEETVEELSAEV